MQQRFRIVPVASGLHNADAVHGLLSAYQERLSALGGTTGDAPAEQGEQAIWFVATGGTEQRLLAALDAWESGAGTAPVLLLAHRGHNSLPAALETLARLQQDGRKGRVIYLSGPEDECGYARLKEAMDDAGAWRRLHRARLGLVGTPSDWLVASVPPPDAVHASWGVTVVSIPMQSLHDRMDEIGAASNANSAEPLWSIRRSHEVSDDSLADAVRVVDALRAVVEGAGVDAVAVRCFDLVMSRKTTGCLALAALNDSGMTAACEGDVASAVGMLWARVLLGVPAWMANPAGLDETENTLVLAHCTVAPSMVRSYSLRSHFESGLGVAIAGQFDPGAVTLLRVGGRRLDQVWIAEGELLSGGAAEDLCRTQVTIRLTHRRVGELTQRPLGNHIVMIRGHHAARLQAWRESYGPS